MNVREYAQDVAKSVEEILQLCKKLGINVTDADDYLDDEAIILLDNEANNEDDSSLESNDNYEVDDEELELDLGVNTKEEPATVKIKKKPAVNKNDNQKYLKEKKALYKHKEKLQANTSKDDASDVIFYKEGMTVSELAESLKVGPNELLKKLLELGIIANLNKSLDYETVELLVLDYKKELKKEESRDISNFEEFEIIDDEKDLVPRPPVVTIMGHVDHGKTSLLDAIRDTHVVLKEAGGITQHIGAYQVKVDDRYITFIDTPGHEAFTQMRARGASVTDIVVIVVAADDGIKPQTVEAIDHAKAAGVPIIIAINKMDLPNANPDRVLQELVEYGLTPEQWGGDTLVNKLSAKTKEGLKELLDNILLVADMNELKGNPNRYATGSVIEARMSKNTGCVVSLLIQNGTLRLGDPIVVGDVFGKVRTLKNDLGQDIAKAGLSCPVEVTGLTDLPVAGDRFMAFETEKEAKRVATERSLRKKEANSNRSGMTLDDLFNQVQEGTKRLKVVLKTDVKGSEEAIKSSLLKIDQEGVKVEVIRSGVGAITESDVTLANASKAIIIGFNVRPSNSIVELAKEYQVDIRLYSVIYQILEDIEQAIIGMLDPVYEEKVLGNAVIRQIFKFSKVGTIAGCYVEDGVIKNGNKARVIRDGIVIFDGKIASVQRGKDKVTEVKKGIECGLTLDSYNDLKENDVIEAYQVEEVKR